MSEPTFTKLTDLASEKLGGKVLTCSDDFFAEKENLIKPGRGIFIADKYTDRGKWMDGWESRRKRTDGHDWCIIELATSGKIQGVDIDTNHFLGNHPPHASVEAAYIPQSENIDFDTVNWKEILTKSPLQPGSQNFYEIADRNIYTHIKLHIYPDGGVARMKVYGEVHKDWNTVDAGETVNLAAATNGAKAVLCNDMFFSHMNNLLMPGRGINMGDGWETKRNRTPNNRDWVILKLAHKGNIVEGCEATADTDFNTADIVWKILLPHSKLQADHEHFFEDEIKIKGPFTHVRLSIFPDGGVSRLRLWGRIVK